MSGMYCRFQRTFLGQVSTVGSQLQVLYYRLKPGATSGESPYSHESDEECGIVLRGELEVTVAKDTYTLTTGDAITFDSHLPHAWRNASDKECEALWVVTPPGY